jgi:hypothetical protein
MLGGCVSVSSLEQHFPVFPHSHVHKFGFGLVIRHFAYGYVAQADGRDFELKHRDTVFGVPHGHCGRKYMSCGHAPPEMILQKVPSTSVAHLMPPAPQPLRAQTAPTVYHS